MTWRPISEAPKDGTRFVAANQQDAYVAHYDEENGVWTDTSTGEWFGALINPPTHWCTLPAPPPPGEE